MTSSVRAPTHRFQQVVVLPARTTLLPEHIEAHRVPLAPAYTKWLDQDARGDNHARLDPERKRKESRRLACGVLLLLLVSGCGGATAANPESSTASASGEVEFVSRRPNEISRDEIMARGTNAHHAHGTDPASASGMAPVPRLQLLYRPRTRCTRLCTLTRCAGREGCVPSFRFRPQRSGDWSSSVPADATIRWGTGHQAGVIWIVTGR